MTDLYYEPVATKLEEARAISRTKGRLTYDCGHCIVISADRVSCEKHYMLASSKKGDYYLPAIIRGIKLSVCQKCKDFEGRKVKVCQN